MKKNFQPNRCELLEEIAKVLERDVKASLSKYLKGVWYLNGRWTHLPFVKLGWCQGPIQQEGTPLNWTFREGIAPS